MLADSLARLNHAQRLIITTAMLPTTPSVFVELITVRGVVAMIAMVFPYDDRWPWMPIRAVGNCIRFRRWVDHARVHNARGRLDNHRRRVDDYGRGCDVHGGG